MKIAEEIARQKIYSRDDMALILSEAMEEIGKAIDILENVHPYSKLCLKDRCREIIETAFVKNL